MKNSRKGLVTLSALFIIAVSATLLGIAAKEYLSAPASREFTNCQIQFFVKSLDELNFSKEYYEQCTYFVILIAKKAKIDLNKQLLTITDCEYGIPDDRGFHDPSWTHGHMWMRGDLKINLKKKAQSPGTIFISADRQYVYSYNKGTKKFEFIIAIKRTEEEKK